MEVLVVLLLQGLVIGALGRLAVPGPDPMPWWLTLAIGLVGAFVGGGLGYVLGGAVGAYLVAVVVASLLVIAYRRFVQGRPVTGPDAFRVPPRRRRP